MVVTKQEALNHEEHGAIYEAQVWKKIVALSLLSFSLFLFGLLGLSFFLFSPFFMGSLASLFFISSHGTML